MKESAKTPESFEKFLAEGANRAPGLYGGKVVHKAEPEAKESNVSVPIVPVVKPGSKPWDSKEREDWAMRAANDVEMENDAQEPE